MLCNLLSIWTFAALCLPLGPSLVFLTVRWALHLALGVGWARVPSALLALVVLCRAGEAWFLPLRTPSGGWEDHLQAND